MKRLLSLTLTLVMVFSLSACGKSEAAKGVDDQINAIGEVTLDSESKITEAESALAALSQEDRDQVDGAGELKTFFSVVFPMIKPGIGALAIFTFVNTWNDYFLQLVMLTSEEKWTLPLAIANMQGEMSSDFGLIMAGAALASIPIIVVFIAFQKYFTQGITMGAVKG